MKVRIIGANVPVGFKSGDLIELNQLIEFSEAIDLDLIECGENDGIKLYKVVNFEKEQYNLKKKEKNTKPTIKEIKLNHNIDDYDLKRKLNQIVEFYNKGFITNVIIKIQSVKVSDIDIKEKYFENKFKPLSEMLKRNLAFDSNPLNKWTTKDGIEFCNLNLLLTVKK